MNTITTSPWNNFEYQRYCLVSPTIGHIMQFRDVIFWLHQQEEHQRRPHSSIWARLYFNCRRNGMMPCESSSAFKNNFRSDRGRTVLQDQHLCREWNDVLCKLVKALSLIGFWRIRLHHIWNMLFFNLFLNRDGNISECLKKKTLLQSNLIQFNFF